MLIGPIPCYLNDGAYRGGFERADLLGLLDMMEKNYFSWAGTLAPVIVGADNAPEDVAELQESFCATAPESVGQYLLEHLPAATLHLMEATGHVPHLTHPEETIRVIRRYLAEPAHA